MMTQGCLWRHVPAEGEKLAGVGVAEDEPPGGLLLLGEARRVGHTGVLLAGQHQLDLDHALGCVLFDFLTILTVFSVFVSFIVVVVVVLAVFVVILQV
jgi:hypothetical protein